MKEAMERLANAYIIKQRIVNHLNRDHRESGSEESRENTKFDWELSGMRTAMKNLGIDYRIIWSDTDYMQVEAIEVMGTIYHI